MKPAAFHYHRPRSTEEACALLRGLDNAKVLAGGQSLVPMLNFRVVQPDHLIDLNGVPDLAGVREQAGQVDIGAMTRQCAVAAAPAVARQLPLLVEALSHVGHQQTRNRGTLGGSLCHLDPAAELLTASAVLDAQLCVRSGGGTRKLAIADWGLGYLTPALAADELLCTVAFAPWPTGHGWAFEEFARRHGDFAIVCVAALLARDHRGRIARAALAVGGCAAAPIRLVAVEQALVGELPSPSLWDAAADGARAVEAMGDSYVSAAYRQRLAGVLTRRALVRAAARLH